MQMFQPLFASSYLCRAARRVRMSAAGDAKTDRPEAADKHAEPGGDQNDEHDSGRENGL